MGIGTLRRHWSSEDTEEVTTASTPSETGEVEEDGTENAGEAQGGAVTPARSATKKDWVSYYEANGLNIPEDATRDLLAEAILGPKE